MQTGNLGGAGPSEGLPEGHPPLGEMRLPEEMKKFIAKLSAEAKNQPENAAAWERLSEVQHRAARVDKAYRSGALESYRHLLELTPGSTKALRGLASIYYDLGDYRSAQPHLENYLTLQPRDLGAQTDLATVKMRLGDVERAIEDYRKVIQANPQFFQAHLHLGLALHQTGKKREALNTLREASKVAGNDQMRAQVEHLIRQLDGSS